MALRAEIATRSGPVNVYSTHLSWGGCQAAAVAAFVRARRVEGPSVVMGDFNADFTVRQRPSATERTVRRRVDFVFLVPGTHHPGRAVASRVVLDRPARTTGGRVLWPSDHFGVLAEIDVGGGL